MMGFDMGAGLGWLGMGMGLWMLLPVFLVVLGLAFAARGNADRGRRPEADEAERILRGRLAAGEIDPEEYRRTRAVLDEADQK